MKRSKFARFFGITFLAAASVPLLRGILSIALCGLLLINSSTCYAWLGSHSAKAADLPSETHIAIPPIIRPPSINLQDALPDDFVVSRQTPYSSGRNEILIVSPSTGTEQRFEINLPNTGSFRIYQASFSNVKVADPSMVVRDGVSLSPADVQAKLANFTISFKSNNSPESAILADGTKVELSESEAVIRSADGRIIETVQLNGVAPFVESELANKSSDQSDYHANLAQSSSGCESGIRDKIYHAGQQWGSSSSSLREASSDEAKVFAWVASFSKRALEDSLVASARNQTLQEIACKPPVQCNQAQTYEGGSEIRTDLFQLPSGAGQSISLEYEFYEIPDRLELYYEGNIEFSVGPASGRSTQVITGLPDGATYVGVKLIGNENVNTEWWYTISCSQSAPLPEVAQALEEEDCDEVQTQYESTQRDLDSVRTALSTVDQDSLDKLYIANYDLSRLTSQFENSSSNLYNSLENLNAICNSLSNRDVRCNELNLNSSNSINGILEGTIDSIWTEIATLRIGFCDEIPNWENLVSAFDYIGNIRPGYTDNPLIQAGIEAAMIEGLKKGSLAGITIVISSSAAATATPFVAVAAGIISAAQLICTIDSVIERGDEILGEVTGYNYETTREMIAEFKRISDGLERDIQAFYDAEREIASIKSQRQAVAESIYRPIASDYYGNSNEAIDRAIVSGSVTPESVQGLLEGLEEFAREREEMILKLDGNSCLN